MLPIDLFTGFILERGITMDPRSKVEKTSLNTYSIAFHLTTYKNPLGKPQLISYQTAASRQNKQFLVSVYTLEFLLKIPFKKLWKKSSKKKVLLKINLLHHHQQHYRLGFSTKRGLRIEIKVFNAA